MKVTVVGLGLIGGSIALDLKARGFAATIVGVEANEVHAREALRFKIADEIKTLPKALENCDLVVLAVPVGAACELLRQVLDSCGTETAITDVGSTKEALVEIADKHSKRKQFVPSHPMAGTENSGPGAAFQGLFQGKTAVICERGSCDKKFLKIVEDMYDTLGMRRVYMGAKEHDMHAAFVSHLSHISSFMLANTILDMEKDVATIFDLAGGGFESTVRLAKSSPDMWLPIFEQNQTHVLRALEGYIQHLQAFHAALKEKRFDETRRLLERANEIRRVLQNMNIRAGRN